MTDEYEAPTDVLRRHLRALARYALGILGAAFALGFIGAWGLLFVFFAVLPGFIAIAVVYLVLGTIHSWHGVREALGVERSGHIRAALSIAAPVTMAAIFFLSWPALAGGNLAADYCRLIARHSAYQEIIRNARHGRADDREPWRGIRFQIDPGPPLRIAFDGEGLLDNWSGIVFDPTGDVMQADGFDASGRFRAPDRVTKLFGGDLISCRQLWRDYYACSFT